MKWNTSPPNSKHVERINGIAGTTEKTTTKENMGKVENMQRRRRPSVLTAFMSLLRSFNALLHRRPLATQIVVSGGISGAGDLFAQYMTGHKEWDKWRTARFVAIASLFITPPLNIWFRVLERINHPNRHATVVGRMLTDQLLFSPSFNAFILVNLRLLEGFSLDESVAKMKRDWYDVYTNSLKIWPAVQLINFYFVPLNYRVLLIQFVAFFWNSWLSYRTQDKSH